MVPRVAGSNPVYRPTFSLVSDNASCLAKLKPRNLAFDVALAQTPNQVVNMAMSGRAVVFVALLCVMTASAFGKKPSKIREDFDLAYGKHERQKLDVVWSVENTAAPVVVFFHGGSWRWGVKDFYREIGEEFAKHGVTCILADYRLYPEVRFPAFVEDAATVLKWTRDHVDRYNGDPSNIFLMGHSSGAHIISHLALDEKYLEAIGGDFSWIKGVVGMSCPYTFQPSSEWMYKDIFFPLADSPLVLPISHVDGDEPPFLVLHGRHDYLVDVKQAEAFVKRIESKGGEVTHKIFNFHGHFSLTRRITSWYMPPRGILHEVLAFVEVTSASEP